MSTQRRKRDSNPRRCDPQQFSRLPHSTTLPFLQFFLKPFSAPSRLVICFFFQGLFFCACHFRKKALPRPKFTSISAFSICMLRKSSFQIIGKTYIDFIMRLAPKRIYPVFHNERFLAFDGVNRFAQTPLAILSRCAAHDSITLRSSRDCHSSNAAANIIRFFIFLKLLKNLIV